MGVRCTRWSSLGVVLVSQIPHLVKEWNDPRRAARSEGGSCGACAQRRCTTARKRRVHDSRSRFGSLTRRVTLCVVVGHSRVLHCRVASDASATSLYHTQPRAVKKHAGTRVIGRVCSSAYVVDATFPTSHRRLLRSPGTSKCPGNMADRRHVIIKVADSSFSNSG